MFVRIKRLVKNQFSFFIHTVPLATEDEMEETPIKTKSKVPPKKPTTSRAKKAAVPKEPKPKKVLGATKLMKVPGPKKSRKVTSDSDDDEIFGGGSDADVLDGSSVEPKQRGGRVRKTVKYDFDSDFSS